jgi:flavin reductase (DIM6/NTAB) family NADH-FMN oxidoreductase RutF
MSNTIDAMEFRKTLGAFVTGVTVVSTRQQDGTPRGFTANSFTSVSLDPALVLICIGKSAASYPVFSAAAHFSISILAEDQKQVSSLFASKAADKFEQVAWHPGLTGSPVIDGSAAWFDCETHQVVEAGDHIILIGRVVDFANTTASPLGYGRGAYLTFSLSQDALAAAGPRARVGPFWNVRVGWCC